MNDKVNITTFDDDIKMYQLVDGFRFSVDPIILVNFLREIQRKNFWILEVVQG